MRLPSVITRYGSLLLLGVLLAASVLTQLATPLQSLPAQAAAENPRVIEQVPVGAVPHKDTLPGLDETMSRVARLAQTEQHPSDIRLSEAAPGVRASGGMVQAVAKVADGTMDLVTTAVASLGGQVEGAHGDLLQVLLPPTAVEQLSQAQGVLFLRSPLHPVGLDVMSEAVGPMGVPSWHQAGFVGEGTKIAVIDIGFDIYWHYPGTELPTNLVVRSFRSDGDITGGGDPHGTAAAEVVHDIAPAATIYLINFSTEVELSAAVDYLISERVDIISSSVGWPGTAYGDGTGFVNGVVQRASNAGILWVQAAGNFAQTHWTGLFTDPDGNGFNNYSSTDEGNTISLRRSRPSDERVFRVEIFLTWDAWNDFTQDYDLFLFRGDTVVAQSTAFQNGSFPPVEHIVYTTATPGDYWIGIQRFRSTRRLSLDLVVTIDYGMEYVVPQESLVVPADSPHAVTVGAVAPGTLGLRPYSSQGPTKDRRIKPDIVAGDQVTTATYGPFGFSGTSAAAPHVAGAGALLKSGRRAATVGELRLQLAQRAIGPGVGSQNTLIGAGLVQVGQLIGSVFLPIMPKGTIVAQ